MKYELIPEGKLFRVRALINAPNIWVSVGDLGGLVSGDTQVSGNAKVSGKAVISGYGHMRGNGGVKK